MKTAAEIIAYLEAEMKEAFELYDKSKGKDAHQALANMIKATLIEEILEEIK